MTVWTEEMIATAAGMKRAGLPATTIAKRLNVTVHAVNQKMSRVGARANLKGKGGNRTKTGKYGRIVSGIVLEASGDKVEEMPS